MMTTEQQRRARILSIGRESLENDRMEPLGWFHTPRGSLWLGAVLGFSSNLFIVGLYAWLGYLQWNW
ncbi:MAG: hypothetical protein ACFCD0_07195 [Gemmataceae bacterium]